MANHDQVEYVGFKSEGATRAYQLRVRHPGGTCSDFTLAIANDAFLKHRLRYQDGPEICFLKLQRELTASPDRMPADHLVITDSDLEDYRTAHTPKAPQRRPKAPVVS
jgi:hypothetical protein